VQQDTDWERFKARLDEHHAWPCTYVFKFIVPRARIGAMLRLLADRDFTSRDSERGRYVAVTARVAVESADEVVAVYREAARIEGLIAL